MVAFLDNNKTLDIMKSTSAPFSSLDDVQKQISLYAKYEGEVRPASLYYAIRSIEDILENSTPFLDSTKRLFSAFVPAVVNETERLKPLAVSWLNSNIKYKDETFNIVGTYSLDRLAKIYSEANQVEDFNKYENDVLRWLISQGSITTDRSLEVRTEIAKQLNYLFSTGANRWGQGYSTFEFVGSAHGLSIGLDVGALILPAGFVAEIKIQTQVKSTNARLLLVDRLNEDASDNIQESGAHSIYSYMDMTGQQRQFSIGLSLEAGFSTAGIPILNNLPKTMDLALLSLEAKATVNADVSLEVTSLHASDNSPFYYNRVDDLTQTLLGSLGSKTKSYAFDSKAKTFVDLWSTGFNRGLSAGASVEAKIETPPATAGGSAGVSIGVQAQTKQTTYRYQTLTNESQTDSEYTKTQDSYVLYKQANIKKEASIEAFGEFGALKDSAKKSMEQESSVPNYIFNSGIGYESSMLLWDSSQPPSANIMLKLGSGYILSHSIDRKVLMSLAIPDQLSASDKLISQLAESLCVGKDQLDTFFKSPQFVRFTTDIFGFVNDELGAFFIESSFSAPQNQTVPSKSGLPVNDARKQLKSTIATPGNLQSIRIVMLQQNSKSSGFIKSLGLKLGPVSIGFDVGSIEDAGSHETIDLFNYWYNSAVVLNPPADPRQPWTEPTGWNNKLVVRPKLIV